MTGRNNPRRRAPTSRWALVRDTAIVLGGALLAIAAAQLSVGAPGPASSVPAPDETGPAVGSPAGLPTLPPLETFGPIVNPSVHIDATPTPVPFVTLRPRG